MVTPSSDAGRITRWHWEKLARATNRQEVEAVLAEVMQQMGEGDIELKLTISPQQYVRFMQLAWFAYQIKEIPQVSSGALADRAFQVYEQYLNRLRQTLHGKG